MKRRRKILLFGLCGVIAVGAVCFFCLRDAEPSYNGRTLSEWCDRCHRALIERDRRAVKDPTRAVVAMGTNAVPILLKWSEVRESTFGKLLKRGRQAVPSIFGRKFFVNIERNCASAALLKQQRAEDGFWMLGTNVPEAIPLVAQRFEATTDPEVASGLSFVIRYMGTNSLKYFIDVIRRPGANMQRHLAIKEMARIEASMEKIDTSGTPAVAPLLEIVKHEDFSTSADAIHLLGILHLCPDQVIPVLSNKLYSTNQEERVAAIEGMGRFGKTARSTLPALQPLLTDTSQDVRSVTTNAINDIVPGTFPNGGYE